MKASYNQQTKVIDTFWQDESIIPKDLETIDFPDELLEKAYNQELYTFTYENGQIVEHFNQANAVKDEINELKQKLIDSDYQVLKFYEGEITPEEFEPVKQQRHEWRNRINELEQELKKY